MKDLEFIDGELSFFCEIGEDHIEAHVTAPELTGDMYWYEWAGQYEVQAPRGVVQSYGQVLADAPTQVLIWQRWLLVHGEPDENLDEAVRQLIMRKVEQHIIDHA
jgi:hypothetical protein